MAKQMEVDSWSLVTNAGSWGATQPIESAAGKKGRAASEEKTEAPRGRSEHDEGKLRSHGPPDAIRAERQGEGVAKVQDEDAVLQILFVSMAVLRESFPKHL